MNATFQQLLNLLVAPPGNLIYHLVLAFSIFASLQVALIARRSQENGGMSGRALLGLNLLLIAQLVLFFSSGLAWQGAINPHYFLPVFDRAMILFSLLWLTWLWCFPQPYRPADIFLGLLNLGIIFLFLFTYSQWLLEDSSLPFNASWQDWTWALSSLTIVLIAIAWLLFHRPGNWGIGLGMFALIGAGILGHLFLPPTGNDFSGYLRLAQLAAFPLLPGVLLPPPREHPSSTDQETSPSAARSVRPADLQTIHAWLNISLQNDQEHLPPAVARAVAHTLNADLCLVVKSPATESEPIHILGGYDVLREEDLPPALLDSAQAPALTNALIKGKALRVNAPEVQPTDLTGLSIALGLTEVGNLLLIPLLHNAAPWGGLLLLTPYSQRVWDVEDSNHLASETENIVALLNRAPQPPAPAGEFAELRASLVELGAELDQLRLEKQELTVALEKARSQSGSSGEEVENLLALQRDSQELIQKLQEENEQLRNRLAALEALSTPGGQVEGKVEESAIPNQQLENELRATLEEVARLQNLLAASNIRVLELERKLSHNPVITTEDQEIIASIVQELRQPMASVMGYTDLLLAETVGILGTLQRKFLERVRSATERLRVLLDDLIQITSFGGGSLELIHQPVDLAVVIDAAITDISARLREKNINLSIELPDELPLLYADREGIQQIIGQLLQNASLATPPEGSITLRAGIQKEEPGEYLILQVTDEGGGIAPEDLGRVFDRRYRADHVLIQGLGDTGVGLSIARTLVEAHGGRIWVESDATKTSTFSVLLPLRSATEMEPGRE